jgi:hypothetical protein
VRAGAIHRSTWNTNSAKFAVASNPSDAAVSTLQQCKSHLLGVETRQLRAIRCAIVYQGVATRNDATTREILVHRTGAMLNFVMTEFSEVRGEFIGNSLPLSMLVTERGQFIAADLNSRWLPSGGYGLGSRKGKL